VRPRKPIIGSIDVPSDTPDVSVCAIGFRALTPEEREEHEAHLRWAASMLERAKDEQESKS
jgi:hypothetical protein